MRMTGLGLQSPLSSGFWMALDHGKHRQKTGQRGESAIKVLIPSAPFVGSPWAHCCYTTNVTPPVKSSFSGSWYPLPTESSVAWGWPLAPGYCTIPYSLPAAGSQHNKKFHLIKFSSNPLCEGPICFLLGLCLIPEGEPHFAKFATLRSLPFLSIISSCQSRKPFLELPHEECFSIPEISPCSQSLPRAT